MHGSSITQERKRIQRAFILPLIITLVVMIILPMLSLFIFSFTSVKVGLKDFNFIGISNYRALFADRDFQIAIFNTIFMLIGTVAMQMIFGTSLALIIYKTNFLSGAVRLIMMFPMVVSPIIVGIIWRTLLMPTYGGFDLVLASMGLPGLPDMLSNPWAAKFLIMVAATWEWTPFVILYVLAGLEGMSQSPLESAKIDGASWWQEIVYIILPMLSKILVVVVIFRVLECMKIFPLIFSMTQGGPGNASEDLTYLVYKSGFKYLKLGYASAVSMFILLISVSAIILMSLVNKPQSRSRKEK